MKHFMYETPDKMDFYEYPEDKQTYLYQRDSPTTEVVLPRERWFQDIPPKLGDFIFFSHLNYRKLARRVVTVLEQLDPDTVKLTTRKASNKEHP